MASVNLRISGLESITADVNRELTNIRTVLIPRALAFVGAQMFTNLQKHIEEDWHAQPWTPTVYKRRTDDNSLGTPLGSIDNMDMSVQGTSLTFVYEPTGEHENDLWWTNEGDEIIKSIQNPLQNWTYIPHKYAPPPPRPFWNNFVDEQADSEIMSALVAHLAPYEVYDDGNGVVLDGDEKL